MRGPCLFAFAALIAGCNEDGTNDNCADNERIEAFTDGDGDGYGGVSVGLVCEVGDGQVAASNDCDDTNPAANPGAAEECDGIDTDCDLQKDNGFPTEEFFPDADGDLYGSSTGAVEACVAPPGYITDGTDCDDTNPAVYPTHDEICNDPPLDDDCDGLTDDADPSVNQDTLLDWYSDNDLDGFGRTGGAVIQACSQPMPNATLDNTDCNDNNPDMNPGETEVCDNGADNDCDGLADDDDDSVDPSTFMDFYEDYDGDGAGDITMVVQACRAEPGVTSANGDDCDDTNAAIAPNRPEISCDTIDNDCDALTLDNPDADMDGWLECSGDCRDNTPLVNPDAEEVPFDGIDSNCNLLEACYQDVDGDGLRTTVAVEGTDFECDDPPNVRPNLDTDCDDTDEELAWSGEWELDSDMDGFGDGLGTALVQCEDPGLGYVLLGGEVDCDDGDADIYPDAPDPCEDTIDQDCDTSDECRTCQEKFDADPTLVSGTHQIRGNGGILLDVYCDMETDGGGWTLVAATGVNPLTDTAGGWHNELTDLDAQLSRPSVWSGLRSIADSGDIRFACKLLAVDTEFAVDLSFHDVDWYGTITEGSDNESCFNVEAAATPAPERRNNLTDVLLLSSNEYDNGPLVSEDTCGDTDDFALDFDDRGMDSDTADGTDWGEADGKERCTAAGVGEAWFIFARE